MGRNLVLGAFWTALTTLALTNGCGGSSTSGGAIACDDAGACPGGYYCQQGSCVPSGNGGSGGVSSGGASSGGAPSGGAPSGGAPSGGAPSGGAPSGGAPSGGAPSGGAPSGGAPGGGGVPPTGGGGGTNPGLNCPDYCLVISANCTGENSQYSSNDQCMNACSTWAIGSPADTSGNTLGCHTYHANAAASDPFVHCLHAGPTGGGVCI